jgi:hypothetical protein
MSLKTFAIAAAATVVAFTAALPASQAEAGHRHHREALYAGAGFLGGFVIGNIVSEHRHSHYRAHGALPAAHVQSCLDRYRSYQVDTNTWTDFHGRTRVCYSPYYY